MTPREISFEVYVLQGGRWILQARHPDHAENEAIDEAQSLERTPGIGGTRVVREAFNPETGTSTETIVYASPINPDTADRLRRVGSKVAERAPIVPRRNGSTTMQSPRHDGTPSDADWAAFEAQYDASKKRRSSTLGVLTRIALIMVFSIAVALLVTGLAAAYVPETEVFGIDLGGEDRSGALFGVFMVSFLLSSVPMSVLFLSGQSLDSAPPKRKPDGDDWGDDLRVPASVRTPPAAPKPPPARTTTAPSPTASPPPPPPPAAVPEPTPPPPDAAEPEPAIDDEPPTDPPLPGHAEARKVILFKFLGDGLQALPEKQRTLAAHNRFGLTLFLVGAGEVLCEMAELDSRTTQRILRECLQLIGHGPERATSFAARYEDYVLQEPRYMRMFQAGRKAMHVYQEDAARGVQCVPQALAEWSAPAAEETAAPVTVMFTDLSGSTLMTQTLGDAAAQEVVRSHNRIVREALAACSGDEIKHTGDGIMASFPTSSQGIEAAILIQRAGAVHTRAVPDRPIRIKVGLNAGEPIAEDDDLFGTTVQLAARIVDKAQAGQILVSETVRGICAGKGFAFADVGVFDLKGFGEDVRLYAVPWEEPVEDESADES